MATRNWRSIVSAGTRRLRSVRASEASIVHSRPDVPYAHVCLTMPDVLWPLFQRNRHLLHDLPVLGAQVLQQWARQTYGIRLLIAVIPHTFGRHLNFNCHLHIPGPCQGRRPAQPPAAAWMTA